MTQCRACHFQAEYEVDLAVHIQRVHGFGQIEARNEAARVVALASGKQIDVSGEEPGTDTFSARVEGNTIIANVIRGYQRQLAEARAALEAIAKLPVGACDMFDDLDATSWNEPCARCAEAHDIARAAIAKAKAGGE